MIRLNKLDGLVIVEDLNVRAPIRRAIHEMVFCHEKGEPEYRCLIEYRKVVLIIFCVLWPCFACLIYIMS